MYIESAILALILGLLLGGSVKKLLDLKVRGLPLLIVSILVSLLSQMPRVGTFLSGYGLSAAVLVAVIRYGFLLAFVAVNYRNIPICIIGAGGLSNCMATLINGGRMPVSLAALGVSTKDASVSMLKNGMIFNYKLADGNTLLLPLCDIIRARGFYTYFLSIGDILISVGVFLLIMVLMEPKCMTRFSDRLRGAQR